MSLASATWFLTVASVRNRLRRWVKRLQQPKYLLATIAAVTYLYMLVFRRLTSVGTRPAALSGEGLFGVELMFIALVGVSLLFTWLFGRDDAVLNFSPAEVQLLFPAPVSRRSLVLYRINRNLMRALISAAVSTVLFGRNFTGHPALFTLAFWLGIGTLMLHGTAASFARQSLAEHGISGLRRRALTVVVVAAVVVALGYWASHALPPPPAEADPDALLAYAKVLIQTAPLSYLLWPIRALTRLIVATDAHTFVERLPAALLVFAAHYVWAVSSSGAFEEASVEAAEARARARDQRRSPFRGVRVARGKSSALSASGRPELALSWKNVLGLRRALGLRMLPLLVSLGALAFVLGEMLSDGRARGLREAAGLFCVLFVGLTALMGPTWARFDFRADLKNMEALRALPLSGTQMALGELAGPAILLAVIQWALLLVAFVFTVSVRVEGLSLLERAAAGFSVAMVAPCVSAAGLVLHNATALLFRDWVASATGPARGVEVLGQRLISLLGALVLLAVAVLPAAALAGISLFVLQRLGALAFVVAGVFATGVLALELFFGVVGLGRLYDRFDVAQ